MDDANRSIYKALGTVVRRRRRTLDLTQQELAQSIGISRGALANIETGRQNVLLHQLYRFSTALDMDVRDLLPPPPSMASPTPSRELPMPKKGLTAEQKSLVAGVFTTDGQPRTSKGK